MVGIHVGVTLPTYALKEALLAKGRRTPPSMTEITPPLSR